MGIPGLDTDPILTIKAKKPFLVIGMTGHEHLGRMYEYVIQLASTLTMLGEPDFIDIHDLMGTNATLKMMVGKDARYFDGYVTRMERGEKRGRYQTYAMTLRPFLWFATQTKNSLVFQAQSVKDILTAVLTPYGTNFDWRLEDASVYASLDYCVQYAETDFDFMSRLMEEVGIYYFFEHADAKHTMVFIDKMDKHKPYSDPPEINWANAMQNESTITEWHVQEDARSVKATLSEYDYLAPGTLVKGVKEADPPPPATAGGLAGAVAGALGGAGGGASWTKLGSAEWYEHPALVVQNSASETAQTTGEAAAKQRAAVRIDERMSLFSSVAGKTNVRALGTGMTFKLKGTPVSSDEGEYSSPPPSTSSTSPTWRRSPTSREPARATKAFAATSWRSARRRRRSACRASRRSRWWPDCRRRSSSARLTARSRPTSTVASRSSSSGTGRARRTRKARAGSASPSRGPARVTACSRCRGSGTKSWSSSSTATPIVRW